MKRLAAEIVANDPDGPISRIAQMLLWVAPNPAQAALHIAEGISKVLVEIEVPQGDKGRIIGGGGRTIEAIRTLLYASLRSDDPEFDISIPDDDGGRRKRGRRPRDQREEHGQGDDGTY